MAHVHVAYWKYLARPPLPNYPMQHQPPIRNRNNAPRHLPILHAPTFPEIYNFYEEEQEEEEQQQYVETPFQYPIGFIPDEYSRLKHQLSVRAPAFIPLQNYYKLSFTRSSYRYFQPEYSL
ncbi:unnamed protein product [Rotaria sordida]|uniref:Uncharacterized protein n=1 Tax=Rotaria sordida TaxID=392033 RepID=A0A818W7X8_9BILA|nr:unnamed protein product [Rotaria sordida]CAF3721598.1 unnamed protein product [Rotaria sordida]